MVAQIVPAAGLSILVHDGVHVAGVAGLGGGAAGFIGVDEIRMLLKKIPSLIFLFNFYNYIILVLKLNKSIIGELKKLNLNILL